MDAMPLSDQSPVIPFLPRRVQEPWKPGERYGNRSAIAQIGAEGIRSHRDGYGNGDVHFSR